MDLRQPDGEFIEVNKARLSMMVHEPAWPEGMEEETRVMAGVMVLFDDWLLDEEEDDKIDEEEESDVDDYDAGLKATAQPQSPKREKEQVEDTGCLNPIALRFFEDWTTCGYILSRSILLAKFYGMIMKWEFDNCSHVAGMSELHLSCNVRIMFSVFLSPS